MGNFVHIELFKPKSKKPKNIRMLGHIEAHLLGQFSLNTSPNKECPL